MCQKVEKLPEGINGLCCYKVCNVSVTTDRVAALKDGRSWKKDSRTEWSGYGRVGLVVRALAFHQCGPGSISALGVIRGLSLLVLYSAMRGFPPGTPVFPSHQKPTFDLI